MAGGADSAKAVVYALIANGAIATTKYIAAALTGSSSMLAEAVHSTADCGNQVLLLFGLKRSKLPPNHDYPLGFGKETYFWSFVVAIMLFSVGGMFSLYEGWHKLLAPEDIRNPLIALGVLGFGIAAESFSMWGAMREVNKMRGDASVISWFRTTRNGELAVIFAEDLAALIGLVLAFAAVSATWATGNPIFDAIGTVSIGVLLVIVAILVAIEVKAMLIGQGVEAPIREAMLAFLGEQGAVEQVLDMLTLHMGSDVMVAVKAKMRPQPGVDELAEAINAIEVVFKQRFPQVRWVFFEPDLR
ncbi:MAG TPA: cation diffusion facilitator family transporter [Usitatibacter sp.]